MAIYNLFQSHAVMFDSNSWMEQRFIIGRERNREEKGSDTVRQQACFFQDDILPVELL